jgi:hypothetical protein
MGYERIRRPVKAPSFDAGRFAERTFSVDLTIAQAKALRATPITLVPAPGAGKVALLVGGVVVYDYAAVYTETADNLVAKYTNGSGAAASQVIETTGFLDATSDQMRPMLPANDVAMVGNAAIVLHNNGDGEFGGTGSPMRVKGSYIVVETGL